MPHRFEFSGERWTTKKIEQIKLCRYKASFHEAKRIKYCFNYIGYTRELILIKNNYFLIIFLQHHSSPTLHNSLSNLTKKLFKISFISFLNASTSCCPSLDRTPDRMCASVLDVVGSGFGKTVEANCCSKRCVLIESISNNENCYTLEYYTACTNIYPFFFLVIH